jgi:hypothetical protein
MSEIEREPAQSLFPPVSNSDFKSQISKFGGMTVESDLSTHKLQFGVAGKF